MSYTLWIVASLVAYIVGLIVLVRVTPVLYHRRYDEELFLGIAALDIFGAMLAFSAVIVTLALFNGATGIRVLDFLMLVGILLIALRTTWTSLFRLPTATMVRSSRLLVGGFSLLLLVGCIYMLVELFLTH
jgi:hypothetical protein